MKRLTIDCARQLAKFKNGSCLSSEYVNNSTLMVWQCEDGHIWKANYNNVKNNRWCPTCYENKHRGACRRLKSNIHHECAIQNNGKCLTEHYINNKQKLLWECEVGHQWLSRLDAIKDQGSWCPQCRSNKNYYEGKTREIFEEIFSKPFTQVRPDFLKNPETGFNLELDGYNEELKIAFEYDGRTHYQEWDINKPGKLEYVIKNDILKDKLCKENKITLIRIPYWESLRLREFIKVKIEELSGKEES